MYVTVKCGGIVGGGHKAIPYLSFVIAVSYNMLQNNV
jgi:hypothetical protein